MQDDVPSPIDLRRMQDAREWAETALSKRPWRTEFFEAFARLIQDHPQRRSCQVLELGSGPGFLAQHLLQALPHIGYTALDFSSSMHTLARERLGTLASRVHFVERNFREPDWSHQLGSFDFIVTHQAVHELRHKKYAAALHRQASQLLAPGGNYLVCDHFFGEDGMSNDQLYMTPEEQFDALREAGFMHIDQVLRKGGLNLYRASL